jgi:hypothetical protein
VSTRANAVWIVFLVAAAVAYGTLLQPPGCNQTAHYALVQALAHGSPSIDAYHAESCDIAYVGGHYYAAKAPGLALFTLPWFLVLKAVGAVPRDPALGSGYPAAMVSLPRRALWQVGLFGAVLPALLLLVLVRLVGERVAPGSGLAVACAVGFGTLILPFATVFFAHALATTLGFAAFASLFLWQRPLLAGALAGLAVCVDFPLGIVAAALAVYAWRRAGPYLLGVLLGLVPLLAFDEWAFRNPFHLSYANAVLEVGGSGHDVLGANSSGFFGIGVPSLRAGAELLFTPRGLFVLTPILLVAIAGLALLPRRLGVLCGAIFAVFLVYDAGYYVPFGGYVPGPRFLVATIPFLAVGLAPAVRAWPLPTIVLGAFSIAAMVLATAAEPLLGSDDTHSWVVRAEHGDFAQSVVTLAHHGHGWLAVVPFLLAVAVAVACTVPSLPPPRVTPRAVAAIAGWLILFLAAPDLLGTDRAVHQSTGLLALIAVALAVVAVLARDDLALLLAGVPLLALALPGFAAHTKHALVVALLSLAAAGGLLLRRRLRA